MTFGISMNVFQITGDEPFPLENHNAWMAQRRERESMEHANDQRALGSIVHGPLDILLGRQWEAQIHSGNIRMRSIIADHLEVYEKAEKRQKTQLAEKVVGEIEATGSRFLKYEEFGYVVVDDPAVKRERVSSGFRDKRKRIKLKDKVPAGRRGRDQISSSVDTIPEKRADYVDSKRPRWDSLITADLDLW
jgi:hypothetical protein